MRRAASNAWVGLLAALAACVAGCGGSRDYELNVRLPAGTSVARGAKVFVDGVEAGRVRRVGHAEGRVVATVVIADPALARARIKPGIVVSVRSDRGLDVDTSKITRSAGPLPSGTTVEAHRKFDLLVRRYATWQTVAVFFVGALGLFLLLAVFRSFFRMGWVLAALALAAGAATLVRRPATAVVESVYSRAEDAEAPEPADGGTTVAIPRPSPQAVAFVASWLVFFVLIQLLGHWAARSLRRKRKK